MKNNKQLQITVRYYEDIMWNGTKRYYSKITITKGNDINLDKELSYNHGKITYKDLNMLKKDTEIIIKNYIDQYKATTLKETNLITEKTYTI